MFDRQPYNAFLDLDLNDRVVGNYRIESEIGRGGFGRVFLAVRASDGQRAALKILNPGLTTIPDVTVRFHREATLASRLNHPNIVRLFDFGPWEDTFYFAMEFVEGKTLWELSCDGGPLPIARSLHFIHQCASALARAHELGIIHRDIKPGNILATATDHAYLLDFGLAKEIAATAITRPGSYLGTLEYMAPEQLHGQPADIRSDLYSLGLVLWQCLTGAVPFNKGDLAELVDSRRVNIAPQVNNFRQDVPTDVMSVLRRLLEFYPSARYSNPQELVDDLHRIRTGQPIAAFLDMSQATTPFSVSQEDLERIRSGKILDASRAETSQTGGAKQSPPSEKEADGDIPPTVINSPDP